MALVNCKECGAEISTKAKACPSCGAEARKKTSVLTWIIGFLVIAAVANVNSTYKKHRSGDAAPEPVTKVVKTPEQLAAERKAESDRMCKDESMAWVMSKDFMKRSLKSPKSADFPWSPDRQQYLGNCTHEIWAYVDAQNSFGAEIRTRYYAKLKNIKGTERWSLIDLRTL